MALKLNCVEENTQFKSENVKNLQNPFVDRHFHNSKKPWKKFHCGRPPTDAQLKERIGSITRQSNGNT